MPILFHSMIFWLFVFQGIIVALDKSEPKISKLNQNCDRLGVCCVKSFVFDGVKALDPDKQMDPDNSTGMSFDCLFIALVVNKIIDFERTENNLKYSCRVYSCVLDFQRTYYVWGHKFSLITNWLLLWIQIKMDVNFRLFCSLSNSTGSQDFSQNGQTVATWYTLLTFVQFQCLTTILIIFWFVHFSVLASLPTLPQWIIWSYSSGCPLQCIGSTSSVCG